MKTLQARSMKTLLPTMLAALAFAPLADSARAALTPIADAPLVSISVVKPNIMFTLDNSGSMSWTYMPDKVEKKFRGKYGYLSSQCNGVYYDPNTTYLPPVDATGASYPNASFAAARSDGFDSASAAVDLGSQFIANRFVPESANVDYKLYGSYKLSSLGPYAAYYYTYSGTQTTKNYLDTDTTSTFYLECASSVGSAPGKNVFTKITVSATSGPGGTDERTNFANWYSYYRTRMLMTKTSVGRAFLVVDPITNPVSTPKTRVGFNTITDAGGTENADVADGKYWLTIRDFDTAQKTSWYSKLYDIDPKNGTPLRTAMRKIGELYRGKLPNATDPVQYSCQANVHILSTDGYWNDTAYPGLPAIDTNYAGINGGNLDGFAANTYANRADGTIDVNGSTHSLADVAMLYYSKDLRDISMSNCTGALGAGIDVCANNVKKAPAITPPDLAEFQHMRTYTIGLGADGTKHYDKDYRTATSGFFYELTQNLNQPASNWPLAKQDDPTAIDDLWHAAVNGHGIYLNAKNSSDLERGMAEILKSAMNGGVSAGVALGGAVLSPGENDKAYGVEFAGDWSGDVKPYDIDPASAAVTASYEWGGVSPDPKGARAKLDELVPGADTARNIVTMSGGAGVPFSWTDISPAQKTALVSEDVLKYLRGNKDKEGTAAGKFRVRDHLLGDIVDSGVVVVGKPKARYVDSYNPAYSTFKTDNTGRTKMLYVGANDGMLHAFDAATGVEKWAYIPSMLIKSGADGLAALSYLEVGVPQFNHHFYVNQTPTVEDVDFANTGGAGGSGQWRTILVGGLNKGGKGFYALDITDPSAMSSESGVAGKVLWEFTDPSLMGYSFGKPLITKLRGWGWVVILTSGYNNATGQGVLFVLNAKTGALIADGPFGNGKIFTEATGEGPGNPSGLARITGYTLDYGDYTTEQVYGGDLFGNMWRFDLSAKGAWSSKGTLFAKTEAGQPITTAPQIEVDLKSRVDRWVFFGTGKYLDPTDNGTTITQTMYAIKDGSKATPTSTGLPFGKSSLVAITGVGTGAAIPANKQGWYVDLSAGERVTIDPLANEQIIAWVTSIPTTNACSPGGASGRLYAREYSTGLSRVDDGVGSSPTTIAYKESTTQYVKIQFVKTDDGKIKLIATDAEGTVTTITGKWGPASGIAVRSNSREILN
jgi:type IV pilus assembly protein PilY1